MQKHLQKLNHLKKIAFSRYSYSSGLEGSFVEQYYEDKFLAEEDPADLEERDRIWEQMHRISILTGANVYVRVMSQLEWLFIGQISMGFKELPGIQVITAVALTAERGDYWRGLRKMFGVYEE